MWAHTAKHTPTTVRSPGEGEGVAEGGDTVRTGFGVSPGWGAGVVWPGSKGGDTVSPGFGACVMPEPVMVPAVGVKLQSGFMQQGLAGSLNRRHWAGRLGNLAHLGDGSKHGA